MVQFWREDLPHDQYVFFYIDVFGFSLRARRPWYRGDEDDAAARQAFQVAHTHTHTHTHTLWECVCACGAEALIILLFPECEDPDLQRTREP